MRIEEVVKVLKAEPAFRKLGKSAMRNSPEYQNARHFEFKRCDCSYLDDAYAWHEFIAVDPAGTRRYVVALWVPRGILTVSSKGYHNDGPPLCSSTHAS